MAGMMPRDNRGAGRLMRAPEAAIVLWLVAAPATLQAQQLAAEWPAVVPRLAAGVYPLPLQPDPLTAERVAVRAAARRSRWVEGAVVGGVLFGVAGGFVAGGFCAADDSAVGAAVDGCTEEILLGGVAGAAIGGLIGGLIGSRIRAGPADR